MIREMKKDGTIDASEKIKNENYLIIILLRL